MAILKTKKADLNIHYKKYFQISMIIVLVLLIAAFKFSPKTSEANMLKEMPGCIINVIDIPLTEQNTKPKLPPRPQIPEIATTDVIDEPEFLDNNLDENESVDAPPHFNKPTNRIIEDETIFVAVEEMPTIIGGLESINKNVHYTEIARRLDIQGKVIIGILVDKTGNIVESEILKSLFPELDMIALNAVKQVKFNPGLQRGKPVNVRMVIPIVFKLK